MSEAKKVTNELLKEKLSDAMVYRGKASTDLTEILTPGIYEVSPYWGSTGFPKDAYQYGVLEVLYAGDFVLQRYTSHRSVTTPFPKIYTRIRWKTEWTAWMMVESISITP